MKRDFAGLLRQMASPLLRPFERPKSSIRAAYFHKAPSAQNALDIFEGEWYTTVPDRLGALHAGSIDLYRDPRLLWALNEFGPVEGKHVIELGPLEGAHTYLLEHAGCASVHAIEGNPRAYLKCLVFKEISGLQRAHFLCGDFVEYLRTGPPRTDLVVASGVLYHMTNPAELLYLISRVSDCLFLWTHYYDAAVIAKRPDIARRLTSQTTVEFKGFRHNLFRYEYWRSSGLKRFCGGPNSYAFWMERQAILDCLRMFGFSSITTNFDEPNHADGPAFALLARAGAPILT